MNDFKTKKIIKKECRDNFDFGIPLKTVRSIVNNLIGSYGEDALFSPDGYENGGDYRIMYKTVETDKEYEKRINTENEKNKEKKI